MPACITWEELQQLPEPEADQRHVLVLAGFLLTAILDWPTYNLQEPVDLLTALEQEVGDPLTYDRLHQYYASLPLPEEGWKVESISSLLHLMEQAPTHLGDSRRTLPLLLEQLTLQWRAALVS
jgi:hypothetical protein